MSKIRKKVARFERRRNRSKTLYKTVSDRPRLCVYRSNKNIEAQIIDDIKGITIISASTIDKELKAKIKKAETKTEQGKLVGKILAERAINKKIKEVVFDRNGFS
ncbi:MAG: 50S ribosomal protein L18, partial [Candidatus Marinimicrobia bacterium]|nr:50S ribosomal protein L18 [Candidatus Neomarinimicrobiota bacterium]